MRRALLLSFLLLPLALAACSDTSNDSSTSQTPYGGNAAPTEPTAPPLTQAEIDKWYEVQLDMFKSKPKSNADMDAIYARNATTGPVWQSTASRIKEAQRALARSLNPKINEPIPAHLVADVELVKTNKEKIEAGKAGKALP